MEGVIRAVKGDPDGLEIPGVGVDFVFGRMRELEALKGWWNNNKNAVEPTAELSSMSSSHDQNSRPASPKCSHKC